MVELSVLSQPWAAGFTFGGKTRPAEHVRSAGLGEGGVVEAKDVAGRKR